MDSTVMPYAGINLAETGSKVLTDVNGVFILAVPDKLGQLTLTISAIGYKATLKYKRTFSDTERVYVDMIPGSLSEVTVTGISVNAKDIVEKAIAAIPANYMNEDYYSFSLFRQYQDVNDIMRNLVEAQMVVKFRISGAKNKLIAKETYAVTDLRRVSFIPAPDNLYEINLPYHMTENPVYHLAESSLDPHKFDSYTFSFDTATSTDNYLIKYTCKNFSTESHGVVNYATYDFHGESWETGRLVIDKKSFAIKKIQRNSFRYPDYDYPKINNLVQPARKYYIEFIKGELIANYVLFEGKWYLKELLHQFTNEFFNADNNKSAYVITDCYEWYTSSISKQINKEFNQKFYPGALTGRYDYDSDSWTSISFPFYFFNKEAVYNDLERHGPIETQFANEANRKEW